MANAEKIGTKGANANRAHVIRITAASFATYNIAAMSLWLQPAIVAEYVVNRGLASGQAGLIASAEMILIAATMMLWGRFGPILSYRTLALAGVGATMIASAGCMVVGSYSGLLGLRLVAAIGFGFAMLVPSMAIAGLDKPATLYARMYAISLIFSAALLAALPRIVALIGRPPAFPTFLAYSILLLPIVTLMPGDLSTTGRPVAGNGQATRSSALGRSTLYLAVGLSALGLSYSSVWAFFIFLGVRAGLTSAEASMAAAFCLIAAIVGSITSGALAARVRPLPIMMGGVVTISGSLLLIILVRDATIFRIGGIMTLLALYLLIPKVLGAAAEIDITGRGVAFVNASVLFVGAAGPYLGGVINETVGFAGMSIVALASAIVSALAFILFAKSSRPTYHLLS